MKNNREEINAPPHPRKETYFLPFFFLHSKKKVFPLFTHTPLNECNLKKTNTFTFFCALFSKMYLGVVRVYKNRLKTCILTYKVE